MTAGTVAVSKTLVLNKDWRPINVIPVLEAVMKVYKGRAMFLDPNSFRTFDFDSWVNEWSDAVASAKIAANKVMPLSGGSLVLPDIIVCSEYRGMGFKVNSRHKPSFSRRNLFLRDRCICQFCGKKFIPDDMNMDHVIPKSKGGQTTWQNIVLACVPCNSRKKNLSLKESGMKLIRKPFEPTAEDIKISPMESLRLRIGRSRPPKTWDQFLGKMMNDMYWNTELLKE
jgi:hypothetical protein